MSYRARLDSVSLPKLKELENSARKRLNDLNKLNEGLSYIVYSIRGEYIFQDSNYLVIEAMTANREMLRIAEADVHHVLRSLYE